MVFAIAAADVPAHRCVGAQASQGPLLWHRGLGGSAHRLATAATQLIERYRWLAWLGLAIILYVALSMIWHGVFDVEAAIV